MHTHKDKTHARRVTVKYTSTDIHSWTHMRLNGGIIPCVCECVWFLAVVGSVAYPGHHVCVASEYVLGPRVLQILAKLSVQKLWSKAHVHYSEPFRFYEANHATLN